MPDGACAREGGCWHDTLVGLCGIKNCWFL